MNRATDLVSLHWPAGRLPASRHSLLHHRIPLPTGGTASHPFRALVAATRAEPYFLLLNRCHSPMFFQRYTFPYKKSSILSLLKVPHFKKMNNRYDYSAQAAQLSAQAAQLSVQAAQLSQQAAQLSVQALVSTAASSAAASEDFLQQFPQDAAATITATTAKDINTFFMVCTLKN